MDSDVICLEEAVTLVISRTLPSLSDEKITSVKRLIMAEEPEELKDLLFMKEEDFTAQLTKLQARKLIASFKESFSNGNSQIMTESSSVAELDSAEPISMPAVSKECEAQNVIKLDESWANNFHIPFDKFPPQVIQKCLDGLKPNPEERAHVIRILAYEIAKISPKPGKKNLECIVVKLVNKYPKSFQDTIAERPFGNGYSSFLHSLIIRFDNINRKKQDSLKQKLSSSNALLKKKQKKCINYQPDSLPHNQNEETQQETKNWLLSQFLTTTENNEIAAAMEGTFVSQRLAINTSTSVKEIIKEWPYLSKSQYLLKHFQLAMKPYVPDWDIVLKRKIPELLDFFKNKFKESLISGGNEMSVLTLLCQYFKEENNIVKFYRECECIDDVQQENYPVTPFIAVFGDKSAVVYIEKEKFSDYLVPSEAFKVWFASYYVFNLVYPSSCLSVMEFIQRGLMDIGPDSSSSKKGLKKSIQLIKELSNFKNIWKVDV